MPESDKNVDNFNILVREDCRRTIDQNCEMIMRLNSKIFMWEERNFFLGKQRFLTFKKRSSQVMNLDVINTTLTPKQGSNQVIGSSCPKKKLANIQILLIRLPEIFIESFEKRLRVIIQKKKVAIWHAIWWRHKAVFDTRRHAKNCWLPYPVDWIWPVTFLFLIYT